MINRLTIIFSFLIAPLLSFSQDLPKINGSFEEEKVEIVLKNFSEQSGYKIYFDPQKIDSLRFTGSFESMPLDIALDNLSDGFPLSHFIQNDLVYVLFDAKIVEKPAILSSLQKSDKSGDSGFEKGLLFSREYLDQTQDQTDYENFVFEIGQRTKLVAGAKSTIAGYVKDGESNEPLPGAIVYSEDPIVATSTDHNGFYSLTLPNGKSTLIIQYSGMKSTKRNIALFSNGQLNVNMDVDIIALQEVTVVSDRDENIQNVQMGVSRINIAETKNVPIVLGEKDVLKVATTFAGVQTVGEGASGFNVRGGKSDQNLMLLDGATIYNASHFFGFFSVFNSDAINSMEIYKSSIPANFGGRLSSVFDIETKSANRESFTGYGGISPITSKLTAEIPLFKKKAGLLLAGRTTYSNWVLKRVKNAEFKDNRVAFYDMIMRYDHDIDKKNKVQANAYFSRDNFRLSSDTLFSFSNFKFTNANASLKWNHRINDQMDGSLSAVYSMYNYELAFKESIPNAFTQDFQVEEATLLADFKYYKDYVHTLNAGLELKNYVINPGSKKPLGAESEVAEEKLEVEQALQTSLYVSDEYILNEKLTLSAGLRYSFFSSYGEQTVFDYSEGAPKNADTRTGSKVYDKGEHIKTYHGPELRLSARYKLPQESSLKVAYNRTRQYIHTLTNSASLSPTDTWRLSNTHLLPQIGDQFSLGYYRNFLGNKYETSVEVYHKSLQNLIDFKVGSQFLLNNNIETVALQGPGKSYGLEFSIKKTGKLSGWVNYSFARTFLKLDSQFPEEIINEGKFYPANHDVPHTVNLVANYKVTHRLSFSYNFSFKSGRPVTYPVGIYNFKGIQSIHYTDRNSFRIPHYMRMDLGMNLEAGHKLDKLAYSIWSFSIYNVLGRDNPFSVFFDVRNGTVNGYKLVVFGNPIPTVTYNFKF
ncbi:MAG: TonB-dependent receptor [Cyclobacteriaceae bacterium]